ncbi:XVIPCD domain-containing protein [Lysobacter sp. Root559]|uniref:XVIPCD domain-containing protein n=1 Tax=Lysobacter sp. Root559 TaxID=1736559 RepID=UPI0009E682B8|nr:XVIPCD domain-containing protein [Lysobacter sp. Root559]
MSMTTQQYANLAQDAYRSPDLSLPENHHVEIGGVEYTILAHVDKESGYQGTIYQRDDTKEIVVAHRGSEFGEQPIKDGLLADGGMVAKRANAQAADALEFTRTALEMAQGQRDRLGGREPQVTVTGHSLGGCLAQITAAKLNLNGETFNPYGAVSLGLRIPEGGNQIVNHVMAGDVVSAASRHFGKVQMYAEPVELNVMKAAGYEDSGSQWDIRNPIKAAVTGGDSHRMHHFLDVDGNGQPDRSILSQPHARELADKHRPMFDKYRGDVENIRGGISVGASSLRGAKGVADEIGRLLPDRPAESPFKNAHGALPASEQRAIDPRHPNHPNHSMHSSLHAGIERVFAQQGLPLNETAERTTAALLLNSRQAGLEQVNHVVAGRSTPAGTDLFAVQGELADPAHKRAQVNTEVAAQIPVEKSFQQLATVNQQLTLTQDQQSKEQTRAQSVRTV